MNPTYNSETSFQAPKQDPLGTTLAADATMVFNDMNNTFSIVDESTFRLHVPLNSTFKISCQSTSEHQVGIDDSLGILSESQMRDLTIEADLNSFFLNTRFFDDLKDIPEEDTLEDSTVESRPKYKVSDMPKPLTSKDVLHRMSSTPLDIKGAAKRTFTTSPVNPTMDMSSMGDYSDLNVTQELKNNVNIVIDQVKPKARTCLMDRIELDVLGKSSYKDGMPGFSYLDDFTMLADQSISFCDLSLSKSIMEEVPNSPDLDKTIPFILEANEPNQVEPKLDLWSTTFKVEVSNANLPENSKLPSDDMNAKAKLDKKINISASLLPKKVVKSHNGVQKITTDSSGKYTKATATSTIGIPSTSSDSNKKLDQRRKSKSPTTFSKISKYAKPGVPKNMGTTLPKLLQQYSSGSSKNTAAILQPRLREPIENAGSTGGSNQSGKPNQKMPDSKWRSSTCKRIVAEKPVTNKTNEVNKDKSGQSSLQTRPSFAKRNLTAAHSRATSNSRGPDSLVSESKISSRRDEYLSNRARSSSSGAAPSAARSRSSSKGLSSLLPRSTTFTRSDAPSINSSKCPSIPSRSRTFTRSDVPSQSSSKGADSLVARAPSSSTGAYLSAAQTRFGSRGAEDPGALCCKGKTSAAIGRRGSVTGITLTRSKPVARSMPPTIRTTGPSTSKIPKIGQRRAASAVSAAAKSVVPATTANAKTMTVAEPKSRSSRYTN